MTKYEGTLRLDQVTSSDRTQYARFRDVSFLRARDMRSDCQSRFRAF